MVGIYVNFWMSEFPQWLTALLILVVITLINLVNVKIFGEMEFWFALIKVVAVIGMIVLGAVLIVTGLGGVQASISNLWTHGGFSPMGCRGTLLRCLRALGRRMCRIWRPCFRPCVPW